MSKKQNITVYFHQPLFDKEEVQSYLKLKTWPRTYKHLVEWPQIKDKVAGGDFHKVQIQSLSYLMWILSPEFHFSKWGLFLTDFDRRFNPERYVKQYGRFQAEGLINHIHLHHTVKNRVAQFELGVRSIRNWINAIYRFKKLKSAVIYLNADKAENFTLSVYSNPKQEDIKKLNKGLDPDGDFEKLEADVFIRWSL